MEMDQKISTWIGILTIILIVFPAAWVCYGMWVDIGEAYTNKADQVINGGRKESSKISDAEKKKIDAWILSNNLNEFGDLKDTVYPGGTPLFNEMTGEQIDKYEYIIKNHPDRPWNKN